jgi:hypothetical protein
VLFPNTSNAVSPQDNYINTPSTLVLENLNCAPLDITTDYIDRIRNANNLPIAFLATLDDAFNNGNVAISQYTSIEPGSEFEWLFVYWVATPTSLDWTTDKITFNSNAIYKTIIRMNPTTCVVESVGSGDNGTNLSFFFHRLLFNSYLSYETFMTVGTIDYMYPAGYEGNPIPNRANFDPTIPPVPPEPTYSEVIAKTYEIVKDEIPQVVAGSLFVGSAYFVFGLFMTVINQRKIKNDR